MKKKTNYFTRGIAIFLFPFVLVALGVVALFSFIVELVVFVFQKVDGWVTGR